MDYYVEDFRGHPSSFVMELATAESSSIDCFAQGFIMAKTFTSSSRNLPIWEVSEFAWRTAQGQDEDVAKTSRYLPIREVSKSAWQTAQAQDQDEDGAETSRNLPIQEVSKSALQIAQYQDQARESSLNANSPIREMARTSPPKPMKLRIYLLECPREGADAVTLLGPASLIASGP
jgi:hypothetical protein